MNSDTLETSDISGENLNGNGNKLDMFNFSLPSESTSNNSKITHSLSVQSISSLSSVPELINNSHSSTSLNMMDMLANNNLSTPNRSGHNRGSSLTFFTPLNNNNSVFPASANISSSPMVTRPNRSHTTTSSSLLLRSRSNNLLSRSQSGINPFYNPSNVHGNHLNSLSITSPTQSISSPGSTPLQTPTSSQIHFDDGNDDDEIRSPFELNFHENSNYQPNLGHPSLNTQQHAHNNVINSRQFIFPKSKSFHGNLDSKILENSQQDQQPPVDLYRSLDHNFNEVNEINNNVDTGVGRMEFTDNFNMDSTIIDSEANHNEAESQFTTTSNTTDLFTDDDNNFLQAADMTLKLSGQSQNQITGEENKENHNIFNPQQTINPTLIDGNENTSFSGMTRSEARVDLSSYNVLEPASSIASQVSSQMNTPNGLFHPNSISYFDDPTQDRLLPHSQSHPNSLSISNPLRISANTSSTNSTSSASSRQPYLQMPISTSIPSFMPTKHSMMHSSNSTPNILINQCQVPHPQITLPSSVSSHSQLSSLNNELGKISENGIGDNGISAETMAAAAMFLPEGLDSSKLILKKSKRSRKSSISTNLSLSSSNCESMDDGSSILTNQSSISSTASSATKQKKKIHQCPLCGSRFQRPEHVKRHMRSHSTEKPYSCDQPNCGKHFNRNDNLKAHLRKIHKLKI